MRRFVFMAFSPVLYGKKSWITPAAVDYVIVGEPEETMVDLARCIEAGIEVQVEGVALRSYGKTSFPRIRVPNRIARQACVSSETLFGHGANRKYPGEPRMLQSLLFLSGPHSGPGEDHVAGTLAGKRCR